MTLSSLLHLKLKEVQYNVWGTEIYRSVIKRCGILQRCAQVHGVIFVPAIVGSASRNTFHTPMCIFTPNRNVSLSLRHVAFTQYNRFCVAFQNVFTPIL